MRPERVEPDGDPAKRIEFHLLMGGRYPDRIGYTWLEFGRINDDGVEEFRTIGCGLRAVQGRSGATPWFFLTRKRIGQDFSLKPGGAPLTRARLEEALGEEGEVFENASRYREAVDRELFGLGRRYDALIDLLIQLRKPQLSRQLDEERLSGALSEALPPISQEVLADVAEAFNGLERERAEIAAMEEAAAATHTPRSRARPGDRRGLP